MLCKTPYRRGAQEFSCGRCMSCRVNRQRLWSVRIQLEAACYPHSSFATLTYSPDHLPEFGSLSTTQARMMTKGIGFRYFLVGEYGDVSMRPHYHMVCFGMPPTEQFRLWLEERWGKGHVDLMPMVGQLARYVAGYALKKMTHADDARLPKGCIPEFTRMSRRPALGAGVVPQLAKATLADQSATAQRLEVCKTVRIDGKEVPVGRTLIQKTRAMVGLPDSWKSLRGHRLVDMETKLRYQFPELAEDREIRRETQADRSEGLARMSKRSKL